MTERLLQAEALLWDRGSAEPVVPRRRRLSDRRILNAQCHRSPRRHGASRLTSCGPFSSISPPSDFRLAASASSAVVRDCSFRMSGG